MVALLAVSGGAFYLLPWPALYLPAFLLLAALTWWRLDLALPLVVLFAPYYMVPKHLGSKEFAPSEILLLLDVFVAFLYILPIGERPKPAWNELRRSPFLLPALLLLVAGALSTLFAADHHEGLRAFREVILEPVIFLALLLLFPARRRGWLLALCLLGAGVVVGTIGLAQFVSGQDLSAVPGTSIERIHSVYGSPDNVGLLLDRVIPLWLAVAFVSSLRAAWRVPWRLAGVVLLPVLLLTWSRGALLAVTLGCLLVLACTVSWGRWVAVGCLVLAALVALLASQQVVSAFRSGHAHTVQRRLDLWRSSLRMIQDHPLVGIGPDNFLHYYAPRTQLYIQCAHGLGYMDPEASDEPCLSHPHNEILDFWLSTGIAGLAAFFWLQFAFWRTALRQWSGWRGSLQNALLLGSMGAMLASVVHGLVDNSYFLGDLAILFWTLCVLVSPRNDQPQSLSAGADSTA